MLSLTLTPEDAYAFRRIVTKMDVPASLELSPVAHLMIEALQPQTNETGWKQLYELLITNHTVMRQIMEVDPLAEPPSKQPEVTPACDDNYVPPLPAIAQLDDQLLKAAEGVGRFHRDCATWLKLKSPMTPHIFLESAPLWAVGLAIARRAVLNLPFDDIYPNLYILWVASTTHYHKTTGLRAITRLVRSVLPHLLLPETTTPEMLMAKLAGERPSNYEKLLPYEKQREDLAIRFAGQRGMSIDEASKILIPKKYMEGHTETLLQLFDGEDRMERELRGDGKLIIYNPSLSLIGATTPSMLARYMSDTEWENGLMARFITLTPTQKKVPYQSANETAHLGEMEEKLKARLLRIYNAFPQPPEWQALYSSDNPVTLPTTSVLLEDGVMARFNAYSEAMHHMTDPDERLDERLRGNYGRLPVLIAKLALNLAVMDWADDGAEGTPRIMLAHWAKGQMLAEEYRASAHRLLAELNVSQDIKNEQKVLDFISRTYKTTPPTKRDIHRGSGIKYRKDADAAIDALLESGVLETVERKSARGRGTTAYVLV